MSGATLLARKRAMFERYPMLFALGLAIIIVSLVLMGLREINEQARLAEVYAGRGPPTPSAAYLSATQWEQTLHHIIEQLIFVGLAALKLGIGFSIAVIVLNIRETGTESLKEFEKAGVTRVPPEMNLPWFTKFPMLLVAGFVIVLTFFALTGVWVYNEWSPIGDQATTRMTLEAIIKPGKVVGTALLLFGIASGLATIVLNLRMQARALPKLLRAATKREQVALPELMPATADFPKGLFLAPIIGLIVVLTAYVPVAAVLGWNRAANLTSAGWTAPAAESLEVVLEHWIESYVIVGITLILFGIGLWLLAIIRSLGLQRERFLGSLAEVTGSEPKSAPAPPRMVKMIPGLLAVGLGITLVSLLLTSVWIGAGLEAAATGAPGAVLADHRWEAFVKPVKFAGLGLVFLGIGMALNVIVVNLQLLAMVLPGVFARFADAVRGRTPKPLEMPGVDSMSLVPKKLFLGILVGFAVVVTAIIPLAWPLRIGTFDAFLGMDLGSNVAAQAAFSLERFLEHLILPYKLAGVAIILYSIGLYFATIIGFVKARKTIVAEGVSSVAEYVAHPP